MYYITGSCLISCWVTVEIGTILSQSCSDINTWFFSKYRTVLSVIQYKKYTYTYTELTALNAVIGFLCNPINATIATLTVNLLTFLLFLIWRVEEYFLLPVTPLTDDYALCFLPTFYQFQASSFLTNLFFFLHVLFCFLIMFAVVTFTFASSRAEYFYICNNFFLTCNSSRTLLNC